MKRLLLLLGGEPWTRESLLLRACAPADAGYFPMFFPHRKYAEGVLLDRGVNPPVDQQAKALGFLRAFDPANVLAYAESFDNEVFLRETEAMGYEVCVARLVLPESPISGEASACSNPIPLEQTPRDWWLDADLPASVLIARLRLHPAVRAIWQGSRRHYVHEFPKVA